MRLKAHADRTLQGLVYKILHYIHKFERLRLGLEEVISQKDKESKEGIPKAEWVGAKIDEEITQTRR